MSNKVSSFHDRSLWYGAKKAARMCATDTKFSDVIASDGMTPNAISLLVSEYALKGYEEHKDVFNDELSSHGCDEVSSIGELIESVRNLCHKNPLVFVSNVLGIRSSKPIVDAMISIFVLLYEEDLLESIEDDVDLGCISDSMDSIGFSDPDEILVKVALIVSVSI